MVHLAEKGRGRALKQVWTRVRRATCSSTWTSTCPPTSTRCCRWSRRCSAGTPTWPSASGSRRGSRVAARAEAGADLARLQPARCAARCGPGSPTRSAGSRRSAATSARELLPLVEDNAWFFDTELLVLAERAGPADPRGAGRLGRRPRQPRRHRAHRASTTCAASPGSAAPCCAGTLPLARGRPSGWAATSRRGRARPARHAGGACSLVIGVLLHAGVRRALPAAARHDVRRAGPTHRPAR